MLILYRVKVVLSYTDAHDIIPTRPTTCGGCTVALAVTLPLAATVIVALVTILFIIAKQLKDARYTLILGPGSACCITPPMCSNHVFLLFRTQLGKLSKPQINQLHNTPTSTYCEDVSKTDVGRAGDHTYTPAIELIQCPAYIPTEVSTGRGGRGTMGEESIYDN